MTLGYGTPEALEAPPRKEGATTRPCDRTENIYEHDKYEQGWEKLKEIDGEAGEQVIESLNAGPGC